MITKAGGPSWRMLAIMLVFGIGVAAVMCLWLWVLHNDVADLKRGREESSSERQEIIRELGAIKGKVDDLAQRVESKLAK